MNVRSLSCKLGMPSLNDVCRCKGVMMKIEERGKGWCD